MAYTLLKNGDYVVNRATYEYMCDSLEDLSKIPPEKITLGSTAIVICEGGMKVFLADGKDNWVEITSDSECGGAATITKESIISALGYTPVKEEDIPTFDPSDIEDSIEDHETRIVSLENAAPSQASSTGTYKLLNNIVTDGTYAVLSLTKDDNDKEYNLSSIYIEMEMKKSPKASSIKVAVNDTNVALIGTGLATGASPMRSSVKCEANGILFAMSSSAVNSDIASNIQTLSTIGHGEANAINKISIIAASAINFPADSTIKICGK